MKRRLVATVLAVLTVAAASAAYAKHPFPVPAPLPDIVCSLVPHICT